SDRASRMPGGPEGACAAPLFPVDDESGAGGNDFGNFVPVETGRSAGELPGDFDFGVFGGRTEERRGAFSGCEDELVFADFAGAFVVADFEDFAGEAAVSGFVWGGGETGFFDDDFERLLSFGERGFVSGTGG